MLIVGAFTFFFRESLFGPMTLEKLLEDAQPEIEKELRKKFSAKKATYPPEKIIFIVLKREKSFEVWTKEDDRWVFIESYKVGNELGALGPKIASDDGHLPEGIYDLSALKLAEDDQIRLQIKFPNTYDLLKAEKEGRKDLKATIEIEGTPEKEGNISIGPGIETVSFLAHQVGDQNVKVLIAPNDLRIERAPEIEELDWSDELYDELKQRMIEISID